MWIVIIRRKKVHINYYHIILDSELIFKKIYFTPPIFQSYDTNFMSIFTFEIFLFLQILYRYMITYT